QADDGIRAGHVTGVQTCALPIFHVPIGFVQRIVFESVDLQYDSLDETNRDVNVLVREGKQLDFSLLFGYGSYELLRGGIELNQRSEERRVGKGARSREARDAAKT